jgi:hypothetical protein
MTMIREQFKMTKALLTLDGVVDRNLTLRGVVRSSPGSIV